MHRSVHTTALAESLSQRKDSRLVRALRTEARCGALDKGNRRKCSSGKEDAVGASNHHRQQDSRRNEALEGLVYNLTFSPFYPCPHLIPPPPKWCFMPHYFVSSR